MDKNHTPKNMDPKHKELEQHEVKQVLDFISHYGKLIGVGIVAATVAILLVKGIAQKQTDKMSAAEQLLAEARSPQQLNEIIEKYGSTPAGSVALLDLAKTQFNDGDYFQARANYEKFLTKFKTGDMRPVAEFGLASCTEADGDFTQAAEQFSVFVKAQAGHYLEAPATLGLARSLKQANRNDEARIVLEDFLAKNSGTVWANQAANALENLDQ